MKKLLLAAALAGAPALAACAQFGGLPTTLPSLEEQTVIAAEIASAPKQDRAEILVAVTLEVGARFHCPATPLESQVLFSGRLAFDLLVRPRIEAGSSAIVDGLRARTNIACNVPSGSPIAPEPAPPAPSEPDPHI